MIDVRSTGLGYLRVGDLARRTGKTVRALHLYEELGLLTPAMRSKGRFRLYRPEALIRVSWIGKLQELGFSLPEIQIVLTSWQASPSAPNAMDRLRQLYGDKLKAVREQLEKLTGLEKELEQSLNYLDTCTSCDDTRVVQQCTACDVHPCSDVPTELVAGVHTH